jgi:phage anti-repressor protein
MAMLLFIEFIEERKIAIDMKVFKRFAAMKDTDFVYVDDDLLDMVGYKGEARAQKNALYKLLQKLVGEDDFLYMQNREYKVFYANAGDQQRFLPELSSLGKSNNHCHLLVRKGVFKQLCLMVNTKKANRIRTYFIQMEEVNIAYMQYQCDYWKRSFKEAQEKLAGMEHNKVFARDADIADIKCDIESKRRVGMIYFVRPVGSADVKIGYTFNLQQRLMDLQLANPKKLHLINSYMVTNPENEERLLHDMYAKYHVYGEWFKLPSHHQLVKLSM